MRKIRYLCFLEFFSRYLKSICDYTILFPVTSNAIKKEYCNDSMDIILFKLDENGEKLIYSTFPHIH